MHSQVYLINSRRCQNLRHSSSAIAKALAQRSSPMVLTVGIFDSDLPYMRQAVYALVHGSKSNLVGLFLIKQDLSVYWVAHSRLHKVEFEEPLCDVGDHAMSQHKAYNRIRAVVLHYFLEAGHLREFGHYRDFWQDFTNSCMWIANEGSPPKLQMDVRRTNI